MTQFPGRAGERGDVARAWARVEWLAGTAARATLGAAARAMGVHLVAAVAAPLLVGCSDAVSPVGPSGGGPAVRAAVPSSPAAGDPMPDEYIITFRDSVGDPTGLARRTVAEHGGTLRFAYGAALKGFAAHLPAQAAEALRRNPQVARVEQDYSIPLAEVQDGVEWGLDRIDQRSRPLDYQYSYSSTGSGVSVYIIDTGIRMSHAQFGGRAVPGYTSVNDGRGGGDCTGHGTHVAGIVGSRAYGVAKAATVVSVRVYDCNNVATLSGMLAGVDWVTKNARKPAVANMSLGGAYSATLNQSVQNSIQSGVTYVVSAGNYSKDACTVSPASVPAAITVGATTGSDAQASFSDFGSCVDLYAPGVSILSTYHTSDTASYFLSGTSMAAPFAAGAAALYLEANPSASPAEVAQALTSNATAGALVGLGPESPNLLLFSRINSPTAAPAPSPTPAPSPGGAVDAPPTASLTASCVKARCTLDASASTDDRGIVSYRWEFGDGSAPSSGSASVVTRVYQSTGTYTVAVTVADSAGQTARAQRLITVRKI